MQRIVARVRESAGAGDIDLLAKRYCNKKAGKCGYCRPLCALSAGLFCLNMGKGCIAVLQTTQLNTDHIN
jgi:hypothetical protein